MPPRKSRSSAGSAASESLPAEPVAKQSKGKSKAAAVASAQNETSEAQAPEPTATTAGADEDTTVPALTMEERLEKMKALRQKMNESTKANRKAVAAETKRVRSGGAGGGGGSGSNRGDKVSWKLKKAEAILDERDAKERGDDPERLRNWEYSIEQNERWEEKLAEREDKRDKGDIDPLSAAQRVYQRKIAQIKPDLAGYAATRATSASSVVPSGGSSSTVLTRRTETTSSQVIRRADVPQGSGNLSYGGHKPDEAAIDRVIGHLNAEADLRSKRSRQREEDDDDPVTYINDRNKHFNKKLARAFGDATKGIRDNFERGTAL